MKPVTQRDKFILHGFHFQDNQYYFQARIPLLNLYGYGRSYKEAYDCLILMLTNYMEEAGKYGHPFQQALSMQQELLPLELEGRRKFWENEMRITEQVLADQAEITTFRLTVYFPATAIENFA
jgi:hypothetical protein